MRISNSRDEIEYRIYLFSDLLQHSSLYSAYAKNLLSFEKFKNQPGAGKGLVDLSGIKPKIFVYLIPRQSKFQTRELMHFWRDYFRHNGINFEFIDQM